MRNGLEEDLEVPLRDALKVIELPIFRAPSVLLGRDRFDSLECVSKDRIVLEEPIEALARRLSVDEVYPPRFNPAIFARFVAKVALGYAVDWYGLHAFDLFYIRSAILGETDDFGKWVGSPQFREFRICNTPMSGGFRILPDNDVLVRIKLFARFDGAEYVVVVGKMLQFYADQYRTMRKAG